ncbi:MAG: hypothetical protein QNJ30_01775 [Kiloniellales bacterium]|nr:hypothetical protein [Kiloniellales bacterium]
MAFVRRRTTAGGTLVTTLMESFRDDRGRPRQRTLANLHGAESADQALARVVAVTARLEELCRVIEADAKSVARAAASLDGGRDGELAWEARIERGALQSRKRWLRSRARQLRAALAALEGERRVLEAYRTWDDAELRRAIEREGKALDAAAKAAVGERLAAKSLERRQAKSDAKLRQLGAGALLDEHSLIDTAKALGVLPEGDWPRE